MDYPSYDPQSPNTPLTEDELATFDDLLTNLPSDGAMTLDGMDGYLTALLVGPVPLSTLNSADWLPAVWGGDQEPAPAPFRSNQQRKRSTVLVLRHLRAIEAALADTPEAWEPVFSVAELPELDKGKGNKLIEIPKAKLTSGDERVAGVAVVNEGKGEVTLYAGQRKLTLKWSDLVEYGGNRATRGGLLPRGLRRVERIETTG